ncbi:MAG: hypothetical protein OEZ22_06250 [Spirochaetia bacterium]|nr:hypothetical protein [Spirochaetia bacterium]
MPKFIRRLFLAAFIILFFSNIAAEDVEDAVEILKEKKYLADTLFEKTVWRKKISNIILEEAGETHRVSFLMIIPYPHNYKSQNYALYYEFNTYREAFEKFIYLDKFIDNNGVIRIKILGSKIISEEVIYNPFDPQL